MKLGLKSLTPVLFLTLLTYTGCAKQEIVRKDDSLAPAMSAKQTDPTAKSAQPAGKAAPGSAKASLAPANSAPVPSQEAAAAAKSSDSGSLAAEVQRQLEKVYFDFDSATLSDAARRTITANAALLSRNPGIKVRVEGNCDERGSDEYNLAIGERRAKAAAQYLKALGVGTERISTLSYGKEKPADPGHDEAAWAKNRRDEFVVIGK
jgi:peptidoglycan-associated lipoprotein